MGTGRLSRRLVVALLFGVLLTAVVTGPLNATGPGWSGLHSAVELLLLFTAYQIGMVAIPLSILRHLGWRLVDESDSLVKTGGSPLQFRVSHLLALITLIAGILTLRGFVQSVGTVEQTAGANLIFNLILVMMAGIAIIGVTLSLLSAAVVTAFWACLGRHRPGYRLTISAVLVTLLCTIPLHADVGGSDQVRWAVFVATVMVVVIASLLLMRHLGVRLENHRSLRRSRG
jgi:hypothetical protein